MRIVSITILGWLESLLWGGICIICEHLVSVDVLFSSFGSPDRCSDAPKELQIELAGLLFTGVAAFSVVQRSERSLAHSLLLFQREIISAISTQIAETLFFSLFHFRKEKVIFPLRQLTLSINHF